jgi:hypothetical protein
MNRKINNVLIILAMSSVFSHSTLADGDPQQSWQLSLLFNPGDHQFEMERRGRVFIYDGLHDTVVEQALDEQYDRIEGMMFVNTVVTDDDGVPLTDPETGELVVEDDGCD